MASAERIFHLMELRDTLATMDQPVVPETVRGEIVFSHVNFAYEPDRMVIKDLSFETHGG